MSSAPGASRFWFFVIDFLQGHPLRTPSVLGQVLLFGREHPKLSEIDFGAVVAYTAVHVGVFLAFGIGLVALTKWAARECRRPLRCAAGVSRFEVLFYGLLSLVSETTRALFPFWTVLGANTLAAVAMGLYLWRQHPEFRRVLRETPLGAAPR